MLCYVMLCYVMLCYVMLCYVMLCYVMLCYVMLCYVMLCYVMLCHVMLCYAMLCYIMLCYVMLCYVMLCYVMLCYVMLCYAMLCYAMLSIYKSQIPPSLEYCSHVWGGAPKSTLCLLDKVQSKAIRLINNPNLTKSLQPLSHRRLVGDLSIFYRYFNGHCSLEIRDTILVPLRRVRTTRSTTHSHPFQVSLPNPRTLSHKSSFILRTCNLWNILPSSCFPESYNLPPFKSNVNKLDLISLSS